jgi:hypothetical protein
MSRTLRQFLILATWVLLVVSVEWIFAIRPPRDDEYAKWLFLSLLDTGMPWIPGSIMVLLIASSLERRRRSRRLWIAGTWMLITACVAWVHLHPVPRPAVFVKESWFIQYRVGVFAYPWLFGLLIALWTALSVEKKIADRSLPT